MTVADVLAWLFLAVGSYCALVATWLAAQALRPAAVAACAERYARPVRVTLVGLVTAVPLVVIGAAVAGQGEKAPVLGVAGMAVLLAVAVVAILGLAGLARRIGSGLVPETDARPWSRSFCGGLVLGATFLLPFAGWFVLLPWALASGFGAAFLAWRQRGAA